MTEEEIIQNAEKYANTRKYTLDELDNSILTVEEIIRLAYITGAHSRDEEVGKLERRIYELHEDNAGLTNNNAAISEELNKLLIKLSHTWISVKERLPEEKQAVFIIERCLKEKGVVIQHFDVAVYVRNTFCCQFETYGDPIVTHWMPVPEVPKPELPK